jgi:hypothetical protein
MRRCAASTWARASSFNVTEGASETPFVLSEVEGPGVGGGRRTSTSLSANGGGIGSA